MDQEQDTGGLSDDEVSGDGDARNFDEDVKMEEDDGDAEPRDRPRGRDGRTGEDYELDSPTISPKKEFVEEASSPNRDDQHNSDTADSPDGESRLKKSNKDPKTKTPPVPTTLEDCKTRIHELEQDINFLKQSITSVYNVFRCFNNLLLDIDISSVPDLVYFMEKLSDHMKESETIKNKAEGALGTEENLDREELEKQIYDVVENCNTCQGVVSKINLLVTKFNSYKRKMEFKMDARPSKMSKSGSDNMFDYMQTFPNEEPPQSNTYFGLPTIQGEDGTEEVIYTGQDFDMDQYLRQGGVKRKRPSKYNCGACGKVFNKLKYVKSHYNHQHVVQKKLFCGVCGLSFSYKSNLTRHLRLIHMEERKEKCPECDESFGTKMQLDSHMRKTHEAPKLHCTDCGQTFIQEQSLRNHGEVCPANNHQVKVMCGICMKSFAAKRYLQNHIRAKHTDRVSHHVCDICNKSFSGQFALKRHRVKKHRDEVENLSIEGESEFNIDVPGHNPKPKKKVSKEDNESMEEGEEKEVSEVESTPRKGSKGGKKGRSDNQGKSPGVEGKPGKGGKKDGGGKGNNATPKTPNGTKPKARKGTKAKSKGNNAANKDSEPEKAFEIISRNVDYDNLLINQEVGGMEEDDDEGGNDRTKFIGAINLQERSNTGSPDFTKNSRDNVDTADNTEGNKKTNKRKSSSVKRKGTMDEALSPGINKPDTDNLVYYEGRLWENHPDGPPTPRPFTYIDESAPPNERYRVEPTPQPQRGPPGYSIETNYNNELRRDMASNNELRRDIASNNEMRRDMTASNELRRDIASNNEMRRDMTASNELRRDIASNNEMRRDIGSNEKETRNVINFPQVGAGSPSALKDSQQDNHMRSPPNLINYSSGNMNMSGGDMNNMGTNLPPNLQSSLDPRAFEQLRRLTSGSMEGFGMNSGLRQGMPSLSYQGMMQNIGPDPSIYNRPEMNQRYYANQGPAVPMMSNPQYSSHMTSNRHDRPDNM